MGVTASELELPEINAMLEARTPMQIVEWAVAQFGNELIMSSSFGAESACLIHMAATYAPRIRIVMVDTGFLFPETHRFMEDLRKRMDLNVWVYRTNQDPIAYVQGTGDTDFAFRRDVESCCEINKNNTFDRAIKELAPSAWVRGIRRDQADTRKSREIVEWSKRNNCFAISPLLPWTNRDIGLYMKQHQLPYHPLVEKGYLSIGCNPLSCTRPVMPGEDPRAGRWAGQAKTECGLHVETSLDSAKL